MRFRRNKDVGETDEVTSDEEIAQDAGATPEEADPPAGTGLRASGPWDVDEVELEEDDPNRIDLGSLVITPREGLDVQLQVDEQSGQVVAAVLAGQEGAVELRAFAAPRHGDIWDEVRGEIAAEVTRRGGTASEAVGPWGPELRVVLTVTTEDGQTGTQPSRVFGIPGPRWLLRATFFGQPALNPAEDGIVESALRDVVVRRGTEPFAPGEALPLNVPSNLTPREG